MAIELDGLYGLTSDGNITTGNFFIGDGRYISNISATYNDANVIALLASNTVPTITVTGNITGGNVLAANYFFANGAPFISGGSGVIVGDQQFTGDGNAAYSLDQAATTNSIIVALNGVTQYPGAAYTVAGNTITFASAISNANIVDIRYFAEGSSTSYGDANVAVFLPTYSGNLGTANTTPIDSIFATNYFFANGAPFTSSGGGNYGNSNVTTLLSDGTFTGDIIPAANATQSLGNSTNQWKDLWVSANTIFINRIPLTSANASTLLYNNQPVVTQNSSGNVTSSGNVVATGNVVAAGFTYANGAPLVGSQGTTGSQGLQGTTGTPGIQGLQGTQGTTGTQGVFGAQGTQGTQGGTGSATTIIGSIATVGGSPQTALNAAFPSAVNGDGVIADDTNDLWVKISGTWTDVGNISGAQGATGTQGIQGLQGLQGQTGTQGIQGIQGLQGTIGTQGATGNTGSQGTTGTTGSQGVQGIQGLQGTIGTQGTTGNTGSQGTTGTGTQGTTGADGAQGVQGISGAGYGNANVSAYLASGTNTANIITTGNVSADFFIGDGSQLTNLTAGNTIVNGTSNVKIATANGNITMSVANLNVGILSTTTVALGQGSGNNTQGANAIAIGDYAGSISQGDYGIAIGDLAGEDTQGTDAVAIGDFAGQSNQGTEGIAIGSSAGQVTQGSQAVAIGSSAGQSGQAAEAVAIGQLAGGSSQGLRAVSIGSQAGDTDQGDYGVAVGYNAGSTNQGNNAVAIGSYAGNTSQAANSIVINATGSALDSDNAGFYVAPIRNDIANIANVVYFNSATQELTFAPAPSGIANGFSIVSIPVANGNINGFVNGYPTMVLTPTTVALGGGSGGGDGDNLGNYAVAIGHQTAQVGNQGDYATAVGPEAGFNTQGYEAVSIGRKAGYLGQGTDAVAIGAYAGAGQIFVGVQGDYAVAIGAFAGQNGQATQSIILNASGGVQGAPNSGFYVNPVRDYGTAGIKGGMLTFNSLTNEIAMGIPSLPTLNGNTAANTAAGTNTVGMMYWDTSSGKPRMWNGSAWLQITLS